MKNSQTKSIANLQEIQPRASSNWEELPLMLFTLLTPMAVGGFWIQTWMFTSLWTLIQFDATRLRLLPSAWIGVSLGIGMFASFTHLGTKKNAWRILSNWRKSSLSKEILFTILFGFGWISTALETLIWHQSSFELSIITVMFGVGLIYNMSQIYRFRAAPGWNTWRTNAGFVVSTLLLGISVMTPMLVYESNFTGIQVSSTHWISIYLSMLILLLVQLTLTPKEYFVNQLTVARVGLIVLGIAAIATNLFIPAVPLSVISIPIFLIVFSEEAIGRWIFYASRLLDRNSGYRTSIFRDTLENL